MATRTRRCMGVLCIVSAILTGGCMSHKQMSSSGNADNILLGEYRKGWIKYQVYQMPLETSTQSPARKKIETVKLSIRVINTEDGTSPLRKRCGSLEEYNTYYEYLLNGAKEDIVLLQASKVFYPVFYAFENNYNVVPYETINVGYVKKRARRKNAEHAQLLFNDKVFSGDTLVCDLINLKSY